MKVTSNDRIRTVIDVTADFSGRLIPAGTRGPIVEAYDYASRGIRRRSRNGCRLRLRERGPGPEQFEAVDF